MPSSIRSKRRLAVALASRLADAGHEVVLIERSDTGPGTEVPVRLVDRRILDLRLDLGATFARPRILSEWRQRRRAVAAFDPTELHRMFDEIETDLVIVDIEEQEALIAAMEYHDRLQVAVLSSFFHLFPAWNAPPLDSAVLPAPGLSSRLRVARAWLSTWLKAEKDSLYRRARADDLGRVETLRSLARARGVRRTMTRWQWLRPYAPRSLPILQTTATELDLPAALRSNVHAIGPLLDSSIRPEAIDDPALSAVIQAAIRDQRPIVTCVFGAMLSPADDFSDRLAAAVRLRPDIQFIVAAPDEETRWRGVANVFAAPWLPQRELLAVSSAAIIHSGTGTLHECAAAAVPTLVYPYAFNDQLGNAARVLHHGIGLVGDRDNDTPDVMVAQLDRLLEDDRFRSSLESFPASIARYERDHVAVAAVEQLLSGKR